MHAELAQNREQANECFEMAPDLEMGLDDLLAPPQDAYGGKFAAHVPVGVILQLGSLTASLAALRNSSSNVYSRSKFSHPLFTRNEHTADDLTNLDEPPPLDASRPGSDQQPSTSKGTTVTGTTSEGGDGVATGGAGAKAAVGAKKRGVKRSRNAPVVDTDLQLRCGCVCGGGSARCARLSAAGRRGTHLLHCCHVPRAADPAFSAQQTHNTHENTRRQQHAVPRLGQGRVLHQDRAPAPRGRRQRRRGRQPRELQEQRRRDHQRQVGAFYCLHSLLARHAVHLLRQARWLCPQLCSQLQNAHTSIITNFQILKSNQDRAAAARVCLCRRPVRLWQHRARLGRRHHRGLQVCAGGKGAIACVGLHVAETPAACCLVCCAQKLL